MGTHKEAFIEERERDLVEKEGQFEQFKDHFNGVEDKRKIPKDPSLTQSREKVDLFSEPF